VEITLGIMEISMQVLQVLYRKRCHANYQDDVLNVEGHVTTDTKDLITKYNSI
jgi:hypothetical protein